MKQNQPMEIKLKDAFKNIWSDSDFGNSVFDREAVLAAAQYDSQLLLDMLYSKYPEEYAAFKQARLEAIELAKQKKLEAAAAAKAKLLEFNLDRLVTEAKTALADEIEDIVNEHRYCNASNTYNGKIYVFYLLYNHTVSFRTLEFAQSFARITGLQYTESSAFVYDHSGFSAGTILGPLGTESFTLRKNGESLPMVDTLFDLRDRVIKLEDIVDIVNTKSDGNSIWDAIKLGFSFLGNYGPK